MSSAPGYFSFKLPLMACLSSDDVTGRDLFSYSSKPSDYESAGNAA